MDAAWIIAACAMVSALGGAVGAWAAVNIKLAAYGERIEQLQAEVANLRKDRHEHARMIQDHESKFYLLEHGHWKI